VKKRILFNILAGVLFFVAAAGADNVQQAVKAYESGDNALSIRLLEEEVSLGNRDAHVFYGLGNAYLKSGDVPRAVLNYERAKRAIPRDRDLVFNLARAKTLMKQQDPAVRAKWGADLIFKAAGKTTFRENVLLLTVLWYILSVFAVLRMFFRKLRPLFIAGCAAVAVLLIFEYAVFTVKATDIRQGAVIVCAITDARLEPGADSQKLFPLYGGMKVRIKREEKGWAKVQRTDGKIGWIDGKSVEKITK
jgi:tetratricopeptide (TPR) repeat protein